MTKVKSRGKSAKSSREPQICECAGTEHTFWLNCVNCGKLACELESSFPTCTFCHKDWNTFMPNEEDSIDIEFSKLGVEGTSAHDRAIQERDRLLHYASQNEQRMSVVDDQSDYYEIHARGSEWLSEEDRTIAMAKEKDRREDVAAFQKEFGTYQVHLDLLNQSVSLGGPKEAPGNSQSADSLSEDMARSLTLQSGRNTNAIASLQARHRAAQVTNKSTAPQMEDNNLLSKNTALARSDSKFDETNIFSQEPTSSPAERNPLCPNDLACFLDKAYTKTGAMKNITQAPAKNQRLQSFSYWRDSGSEISSEEES